mgnify:CR=1 FL=1
MTASGCTFEVTFVVCGTHPDALVNPCNHTAQELAKFGNSLIAIIGYRHRAVFQVNTECFVQVFGKLRLRD